LCFGLNHCALLLLLLLQVAFSAHTCHPNIVQLLDVFADKERRTLVIVVSTNLQGLMYSAPAKL
jgi:amino acid permease